MNDLDDLLCREKAFQYFGTDCAFGNGLDEVAHYLEVYVSFEKGKLDFAHAFLYIGFGQLTFISEFLKSVFQLFG